MQSKIFSCLFLVFLFVFLGCSGDSGQGEVPGIPEETMDVDAPLITLNGLASLIEKYTDVQISVTDESAVTTRIYINDLIVAVFSDKQFSYTIDPYPQPVGNVQVKVISEDANGNSSEQVFDVEIKHLLMDFNLGPDEDGPTNTHWVFFNDLNGNILSSSKVNLGSNKLYTDSQIEDGTIYYTIAEYETYGENVLHSLTNATYKVLLGETRVAPQSQSVDLSENVEIVINRTELVNEFSKYYARGTKYRPNSFSFTSAPSYEEIFGIVYADPEMVYVRTALENAGNSFDGKKENYLYTKFQTDPQNANISLNEVDFLPMDNSFVQSIPAHDTGTFRFTRYGFENQTDLDDDVYHIIYEFSNTDNAVTDYMDLPVLDGLPFYDNTVSYNLDGKPVTINVTGNSLDLTAPSWQVTDFGLQAGAYVVDAPNNNVDYYLLRLAKASETLNPGKRFVWVFRTFDDEQKTTPELKFPTEITQEIGDTFYAPSDLNIEYLVAVDFTNLDNFADTMNYLALDASLLANDGQSYRSVRFFQNQLSGKSVPKPTVEQDSDGPNY